MNINELTLHCYAVKENDQWAAMCLDFTLAAQADTFEEAKSKLELMIKDHLYSALVGEEKEHAYSLLHRRAPLSEWLKYYFIKLVAKSNKAAYFRETVPLVPAS